MCQYAPDKFGVIDKVSLPESSRFTAEAKKPLQAAIAHPPRRLSHATGVDIKSLAHGCDHRNPQTIAVLERPLLLFGTSESDPQHIGSGRVNELNDFFVFTLA